MKKTMILIIALLIICVAVCIVVVNFTKNNNESDVTGENVETTDVMTNETTGETETAAQTEAETLNTDLMVDLSASRGYGLSLVQIDKSSPLYENPFYDRTDATPVRVINILGKTTNVNYVETFQYEGFELQDTYKDESGNTYDFAEDGTFLSYVGESVLSDFRGALYSDTGAEPDINEEEALEIAENIGKEYFGESFDKVKLESIEFKTGIYYIDYYQWLGADSSILGLRYFIQILADGRVFTFGMPNIADLRDLDESKYENITKEDIAEEIAVNASKVFGEKKVDFPLNDIIHLYKINGKYALHAMTESRSGGADIYYEVTDPQN